jgi:hypothetical protein
MKKIFNKISKRVRGPKKPILFVMKKGFINLRKHKKFFIFDVSDKFNSLSQEYYYIDLKPFVVLQLKINHLENYK